MLRWISDSLEFLFRLGLLQLARLAVVLFCIVEVLFVVALWGMAFSEYVIHDQPSYFWIPVGATVFIPIQVALWQFTWLRIAQRGGHWRAIAECFTIAVRYPVVRNPHPWE
jgi:hypothetical protein